MKLKPSFSILGSSELLQAKQTANPLGLEWLSPRHVSLAPLLAKVCRTTLLGRQRPHGICRTDLTRRELPYAALRCALLTIQGATTLLQNVARLLSRGARKKPLLILPRVQTRHEFRPIFPTEQRFALLACVI